MKILFAVLVVLAGLLAVEPKADGGGGGRAAPLRSTPRSTPRSSLTVERHHYGMTARVRPLLVFWISRSGVGDAVVTKRRGPDETGYSLLIGSDPERAPRRINRWGYIDEEIRGAEAYLFGLMTQSDEQSVEEAEAHLRQQASGDRTYEIIQATIEGEHARSVVTAIRAPADFSFRQVRTVVDLARRGSAPGKIREVDVPPGTRPGFLCALADLMHEQALEFHASGAVRRNAPVSYVYHGRIYQLHAAHAQPMSGLRVGPVTYPRVITAELEIKNTYTGELTRFSMTYGTEGPLAELPLTVSYQPRWWIQVDLALDDAAAGPLVGDGLNP